MSEQTANAIDAALEPPRLLRALRPARGVLKLDYEDFVVEELPLYAASGEGTHTYFLLEKTGLGTPQAVHDIAAALGVLRRDIGYAGLKDARGVTRQWMSVEHVEPERLERLEIPRLRVLEVSRHSNKLRLGHLRGNRFTVRVRDTEGGRLAELQDGLAELCRRGVPNYFGPQRFGGRGDAWAVGRAIVRDEAEAALDLVLGQAGTRDHGGIRRARQLYDAGDYEQAVRHWPGMFREERRALKVLMRSGGKKRRALLAIDKRARLFYVSAYQSYLFNLVVAARLKEGLDRLWEGDLAWVHANGAVFRVEDPGAEQPRADALEISPTGPLPGYRMTEPGGRAGELEAEIFEREGLRRDAFRSGALRVKGVRRPVRFPPTDAQIRLGADERGAYLELTFTLPRGCYATTLLRELFRSEPVAADTGVDGTEEPGG